MIIKRFQAKTEQEAIENAKKELGAGVVTLNVKNVKKKGMLGLFQKTMVEVTVALEDEKEKTQIPVRSVTSPDGTPSDQKEEPEVPVIPPLTALERLAKVQEQKDRENANPSTLILEERLDNLENLLKQQIDGNDSSNKENKTEAEDAESETMTEQMKFMKLLYNTMVNNEVYEKYANQIIEEAEKSTKPNMPLDYCLTNVYQKMILRFGQPKQIEPVENGTKVVFFIGPTGVGKTTTIAKLASRFCLEEKKKVALLTADTYRIAAVEQLRTYANILGIPFRIVYSVPEIEQIYNELDDYDYILVDTAGHSQYNEEQRKNTELMVHALDKIASTEVYLVLSATTKYRDLINIVDVYKEMADYSIIFTKLDETTMFGNLLNLRLYTGAPLSYITHGQNVPADIERFNPQTIVKKILSGKAQN